MQRRPYSLSNGNTQAGPNVQFSQSSLRQHLKERWFITLIGVVGFVAGMVVIIGNEARAVKITKSLDQSISLVTTVTPDAKIDSSNIGKLIYLTGEMTIHEPLTDVDYGVSVLAVKLLRVVQMYQWIETETEIYDDVGNVMVEDYHYHTDWSSRLIASNTFFSPVGHWNPKEFPVKQQTQINENVKIGNYRLGLDLKKKFTDFVPITGDERPERKDIKLHSGIYYHCQDLFKPEVGDVRIQFYYAGQHGQVVTIVAQLDKNFNLVPYSTEFGVKILIIKLGHYSVEDVFISEHSQNKFLTWTYRGVGWLLLYISCVALAPVLNYMFAHSPLLQKVIPLTHSSLKMTVSMCLSLMTTALAWVWYRPILGFGLIFMSISYLFCLKYFTNNQLRGGYRRL